MSIGEEAMNRRHAPVWAMVIHMTVLATGCNWIRGDIVVDGKSAWITERYDSPDGSRSILAIVLNGGAWSSLPTVYALVPRSDTLRIPRNRILPCSDLPLLPCYSPDHWVSNDTFSVYLNDLGYARLGKVPDGKGFELDGVWFHVEYRAYAGLERPIIEHIALSPNDQRIMVAYRYRGVSELQLSVIPVDARLPLYGNVLILPETSFDPIRSGKWTSDQVIALDLPNSYAESIRSQLNEELPVAVDFVSRENSDGWYNQPLSTLSLNDTTGVLDRHTFGIVTRTLWMMEGTTSMYRCEYEFSNSGDTIRSYFRTTEPFSPDPTFKEGDSIDVLVSKRSALLHIPMKNGQQLIRE